MIFLLSFFFSSCGNLLHKSHSIQDDKQFRKTENKNFNGEKALTQWWYFDFFFDDGSVLVLMFVPHHWWTDPESEEDANTLIYVSYLNADGELVKSEKIVHSSEIQYDENGLKSPYLEILKSHDKKSREYTINFFLDEIQGTAKITSDAKAFSPLPTGSMGPFGTRHILRKGKNLAYRYAAHVPQGEATVNLDINDIHYNLSGKAYNEQGWFSGQAHQMGDGWVWFHFVSENINLFGARSFFFLEMNDEILIGGLNSSKSRCVVKDSVMSVFNPNFLMGAGLSFESSKLSLDVTHTGASNVRLIYIPSDHTDQVWGTVLQPSKIILQYKGQEIIETGRMLIETSGMKRIISSNNPVITKELKSDDKRWRD